MQAWQRRLLKRRLKRRRWLLRWILARAMLQYSASLLSVCLLLL